MRSGGRSVRFTPGSRRMSKRRLGSRRPCAVRRQVAGTFEVPGRSTNIANTLEARAFLADADQKSIIFARLKPLRVKSQKPSPTLLSAIRRTEGATTRRR